jgi:hypothetical protein
MRLLADENLPGEAVASLKANGHDVVWIRDAARGSTDDDVFALAMNETRILLTFDKDFGELAWRRRQAGICGVILFRLRMPPPGRAAAVIVGRIAERDDWQGHFSIIEPGRIRMRPLESP